MQWNLCSLENEIVTFLSDIHRVILETKSMRQLTKPHLAANGFPYFSVCAYVLEFMCTCYVWGYTYLPPLVILAWLSSQRAACSFLCLLALGFQDAPGFLMRLLGISLKSSGFHGKCLLPSPLLRLVLESGWAILAKVLLRIFYYNLLSGLYRIFPQYSLNYLHEFTWNSSTIMWTFFQYQFLSVRPSLKKVRKKKKEKKKMKQKQKTTNHYHHSPKSKRKFL